MATTTGDLPEVLTTAQVAAALGQSLYHTQAQVRAGLIPAIKMPGGHRWRVRRDVVEAILNGEPTRTVPAAQAELDQASASVRDDNMKAIKLYEELAAVINRRSDVADDAKLRLVEVLRAACAGIGGEA